MEDEFEVSGEYKEMALRLRQYKPCNVKEIVIYGVKTTQFSCFKKYNDKICGGIKNGYIN